MVEYAKEALTKGAATLWQEYRSPCGAEGVCGLSGFTCMWGNGPVPSPAMVIAQAPTEVETNLGPYSPAAQWAEELRRSVSDLGASLDGAYKTYAIKCPLPQGVDDKVRTRAAKTCSTSLLTEISLVRPKAILLLGAEAFSGLLNRTGITTRRGQAEQVKIDEGYSPWVVPTLHPNYVSLHPSTRQAFLSDVSKWIRLVRDQNQEPLVSILNVRSSDGIRAMMADLGSSTGLLTFDLETRGLKDQQKAYSKVWNAAFTRGERDANGAMKVWMLPLEHPDAPWYGPGSEHTLRAAVEAACSLVFSSPNVNGHNVAFDCRRLAMLARRHGLASPYNSVLKEKDG